MAAVVETKILKEEWDVNPGLLALGLTREKLLKVAAIANHERGNAQTPYHCANAPGTFSYQHGVFALRDEFVGEAWIVDRSNGVESIWNEKLQVRVAFANVDVVCDDDQQPKPRSGKGAGSERACIGNLFGALPHYAPANSIGGSATYYLMVTEDGTCELSRPIIQDDTFVAFVERIYLNDGSDPEDKGLLLADDDTVDAFDPQIARK